MYKLDSLTYFGEHNQNTQLVSISWGSFFLHDKKSVQKISALVFLSKKAWMHTLHLHFYTFHSSASASILWTHGCAYLFMQEHEFE